MPLDPQEHVRRAEEAIRTWQRLNRPVVYWGSGITTNPVESVRQLEEGTRLVEPGGAVIARQQGGYHRAPGLDGYEAWLQAFQTLDAGLTPHHHQRIDYARAILTQLREDVSTLDRPSGRRLAAYRQEKLDQLNSTGEVYLLSGHERHFNIVRIRRRSDGSYTHTLYDAGHETNVVRRQFDHSGNYRSVANVVEERPIGQRVNVGDLIEAEAKKISVNSKSPEYRHHKQFIDNATSDRPLRVVEEYAQRRGNCTTRGQRLLINDIIGSEEIAGRLRGFIDSTYVGTQQIENSMQERAQQLRSGAHFYVDRNHFGWEEYRSSDPQLSESIRYSRRFSNRNDIAAFEQQMSERGIRITWGIRDDGYRYAYVRKSDQASVTRLLDYIRLDKPVAAPHANGGSRAAAGGWIGRILTALGLGAAAGAAAAYEAPEGEKLSTGASVAVHTTARAANPILDVALAPNTEEANISANNNIIGMTAFAVTATPTSVVATPVTGVAAGSLAAIGFSTASDELQRLAYRHILGRKDTVAPSAGEMIVTTLNHPEIATAASQTATNRKKSFEDAIAALNAQPAEIKSTFDTNQDGQVTVEEVKLAMKNKGISIVDLSNKEGLVTMEALVNAFNTKASIKAENSR